MALTPSEDGLYVKFFLKPVLQGKRSRDAGREIYEDVEYIDIQVRGMPQSRIARKASDKDKQRFRAEYEAFESGQHVATSGTPLEHLTGMSPARAAELRHAQIVTVEHVAGLTDAMLDAFGPGTRKLRDDAKQFLAAREDGAAVSKLRDENEQLRDQLAALAARIEGLEQHDTSHDGPKRRSGGRVRSPRKRGERDDSGRTSAASDVQPRQRGADADEALEHPADV